MTARLRVGMGDSYGLRFTVLASPDFAPATVTGATFKVTKPSGAIVTWTGAIGVQSAASVEAVYTFASSGLDLDAAGTWRAWVQWTVAGQTPGPRTEPVVFQVVAADA